MPWARLEAELARQIQGERLAHSYRVVETARQLGQRWGAPGEQVAVAALMHDWAKAMKPDYLLAEAERLTLNLDEADRALPHLLHGPVGAAMLADRGLVADPAVLSAIRYHTTGRAGMSLLERVIWLADYIEPGRHFPGVEAIRAEAQVDLTGALLHAFDGTLRYLLERGWLIHPDTLHARNWFLQEIQV